MIITSTIPTVTLNGIEPHAYLDDVLERLAAEHLMSRIATPEFSLHAPASNQLMISSAQEIDASK